MFLFQLVYILFLNDIQVRRLSFMTVLRLRQLWPVNMKICRPDALEGLKRRKDEVCIVSIKDDVLKRLLKLPGKSMFKGITTCDMSLPCLTCVTAATHYCYSGYLAYGFNYDETLCGADVV